MPRFPQILQKSLLLTIILIVSVAILYQISARRLPISATIEGVDVSLLTKNTAQTLIRNHFSEVSSYSVILNYKNEHLASTSAQLGARYDVDILFREFDQIQQQPFSLQKMYASISFFFSSQHVRAPIVYDEQLLRSFITKFKNTIDFPAAAPRAELTISGSPKSLTVFAGRKGIELQVERTIETISKLHAGESIIITPVVEIVGIELTPLELDEAKKMYTQFVGKSIELTAERFSLTIPDKKIISFISPTGKPAANALDTELQSWKKEVETPAVEPEFTYNTDTFKVMTFTPPRDGRSIVAGELIASINQYIEGVLRESSDAPSDKKIAARTTLSIPLQTAPPQKKLSQTNSIGINERIGFGESYYAHSIPNRIHNVAITTQKINAVIVKPGEEFSFNKTVGDVSAATGYKSAYIIKNGQTALGDGGGVCQVSTTLFRSTLNAGLKITRRLPHSYRVSYYELDRKPGVDATVYSGETDFRFMNDTGHAILISAQADSKKLYMYVELYGTSDGRTTEIVDHKTWNPRPALQTEYIPDPTLPHGKLVQVDWAAPGIDASFKNVIKDKSGNVIREDTYVSKYRPWSAKFLRGV